MALPTDLPPGGTLETALAIAARAHAGVPDKSGEPYILHPLRVALSVRTPAARIVAVLHDVVEDTAVTLDDLRAAGFSPEVIDAVDAVTNRKKESYADFVVRCSADPVAREVKLADLADNSRLDRALMRPGRVRRDAARTTRYLLSYQFLTGRIDEAAYRSAMSEGG